MSRQHLILLGYQVGIGEHMTIPLGHMAVVGITQQSGKTTTLESLAHRSGRPVLAFVTKRGEGSFGAAPGHSVNAVQPYFRERADWQFVEAVLEATMRERMKYDRQWIMKVSRGATTLMDVRQHTVKALDAARGEFMKGTYEKLLAYLDIVVPQLNEIRWAPAVQLRMGLNVMNLSGMSSEVQGLVIASCLDYVMAQLKDTIVIVPEAWEFLPRGRKSPVTLAGENFARKGAALRNFLWIDSQDLAGVHTPILKQVTVWLLGVQREINEVKRTLAMVPSVPKKLKPEDVTTLGLGQFWAVHAGSAVKTYVMPWWMEESDARRAAMDPGILPSYQQHYHESHKPDHLLPLPPTPTRGVITDIEDPMDAQLRQERDNLKAENKELRDQIADLRRQLDRINQKIPKTELDSWGVGAEDKTAVSEPIVNGLPLGTWPAIRAQILADNQILARIAAIRPELIIEVTPKSFTYNGDSAKGRLAKMIANGLLDEPVKPGVIVKEFKRTGGEIHPARLSEYLGEFVSMGFLVRVEDLYQRAPRLKVTTKELQAV